MGVSHYTRYQVSAHAKERYKERINKSVTEIDMLKDIRQMMSKARFLNKERRGCESWLHEERNVVFLLDTKKYQVVTVYNTVEQYTSDKHSPVNQIEAEEENEIHPKVATLLSNFSGQAYTQQEKLYFSKLEPMYKEYAERIGNLSRMKNTEQFENKKIELNELQREIKRVNDEKNRILNDLKRFMKGAN